MFFDDYETLDNAVFLLWHIHYISVGLAVLVYKFPSRWYLSSAEYSSPSLPSNMDTVGNLYSLSSLWISNRVKVASVILLGQLSTWGSSASPPLSPDCHQGQLPPSTDAHTSATAIPSS